MKELILQELDLVCQRIADSSIAAELTGESEKRDNAIRNKARKVFVQDVRAIVQDPKQGGSPVLALIRQDALPSSVQKKPSLFAKAILLNQAKVLAAHVFNLTMDGNTVEALHALTQLAWRGGAWATFSSEASRSSRAGKATGRTNTASPKFQGLREADRVNADRAYEIVTELRAQGHSEKAALITASDQLSISEGKPITPAGVKKRLQRRT